MHTSNSFCHAHKQLAASQESQIQQQTGIHSAIFACGKLLLLLQEDAGKAQDAATAVASLESELEQATRREEQLRASRAQCEYQLQQAGEVAQSQVIFTLHVVVAYQGGLSRQIDIV